jgi:DNA-binding transcriptional LysR family regulator
MSDPAFWQRVPNDRHPRYNLQQLRYAVTAAELGSFRQAAEVCGIKQSTLSRAIQQLEHLIGITIFERSNAGIRPTEAGRDFLQILCSILAQMDILVATTLAKERGNNGRLGIGFHTSLTTGNLRAFLLDFKHRYPQFAIGTTERSRFDLMTALRNSFLDILIVAGNFSPGDLKVMPLWSERVVLVLPQGHPLAKHPVVYWTDLRDQTLLLSRHDRDQAIEALVNTKLAFLSDRPIIEYHDVSQSAIKSLIGMGLGMSPLLESAVGESVSGLTHRDVRDGMGPSHIGFSAVWRPNNESPALAKFLELLGERYPSPTD